MHASRESNRYAQGSRLGARRVPRIRLETYNFLPKEFLRTFSSNVQKRFERLLGCHDRRAIIAGGTLTHPIHEVSFVLPGREPHRCPCSSTRFMTRRILSMVALESGFMPINVIVQTLAYSNETVHHLRKAHKSSSSTAR